MISMPRILAVVVPNKVINIFSLKKCKKRLFFEAQVTFFLKSPNFPAGATLINDKYNFL